VFPKTAPVLFAVLALAALTGCGAMRSSSKVPDGAVHGGIPIHVPMRDPEPAAAMNVREPYVPAVPERTYEPPVREIQCWQCQ
jgi:hypothetical protein